MNILRHKKWHVRTKENVARVRRDEAKAAEEEKARTERAAIADHEDRVRRLKARAQTSQTVANADDIFGSACAAPGDGEGTSSSNTKHVNLFAELEEQERKNLTVGNKEYEAEKKKEDDDWASKVGIFKRFAEDTKEYAKDSEWWQNIPLIREKVETPAKSTKNTKQREKFLTKEEKRALKREKKRKERKKKSKKKRRRRSRSSSISSTDSEEARERKEKLAELRQERLARERNEQTKTRQLLEPKKESEAELKKSQVDMDRERKYNSQFNPEFARF